MQGSISKKRLYEERIVKVIMKLAILKVLKCDEIDIDKFIDENFNDIVTDALDYE